MILILYRKGKKTCMIIQTIRRKKRITRGGGLRVMKSYLSNVEKSADRLYYL